MVLRPFTTVGPEPLLFEPMPSPWGKSFARDIGGGDGWKHQCDDRQHGGDGGDAAAEPPAETVQRGDARCCPAIAQRSEIRGRDDADREHHRNDLGQRDRVRVRRVDDICGKNREDGDDREDAAMLAQDHPPEPVAAEEEDRAQPHGEIPVLCRRETGEERAQVVTGDGADGLTRHCRHRREGGGHDRRQAEKRRGDCRRDPRCTGLSEERRLDDRGDRDHDRATAAVHPTRGEHRPRRRADQRDAQGCGDLEVVAPPRLSGPARGVAEFDGTVDVDVHDFSRLPRSVRPNRARRHAGPPTSRAQGATRRECAALDPSLRRMSAR